jgi:hypothetical protein
MWEDLSHKVFRDVESITTSLYDRMEPGVTIDVLELVMLSPESNQEIDQQIAELYADGKFGADKGKKPSDSNEKAELQQDGRLRVYLDLPEGVWEYFVDSDQWSWSHE